MTHREVDIPSIAELGKILRSVRKESGLTQRDAAALCNVSSPFLNGLEQGKPTDIRLTVSFRQMAGRQLSCPMDVERIKLPAYLQECKFYYPFP